MTELICMGEPMLELNQQPPGPGGESLFLAGHGGDTSNAAIAAARQGASVAYLTAVGVDAGGASFMELWSAEGVDTSHVVQDAVNPTAVYLVHHGPDGHEFQYYRQGSAASMYAPTHVPDEAVRSAKILYASGISQGISNSAADAVFHAIDVARAAGVRVAYDTNYRPRLWPAARASAVIHAAISQSSIALPGLDDAEALTGLSDPDAIVDFYLHLGPSLVALKMGAAGTLLATPQERLRIAPFPCQPVDATGAGDTFCGAFLARLIAGDAPPDAARYAACAAALSTTGYGAVPPIPRAEAVMAALAGAPEF
ncbi:MAG TPA: sugar kinase [Acetobacteraceae bacterium]|nr:sugar kinase [Acetobacteraceae bacterium]